VEKTIASVKWYADCASFWLRCDERATESEVVGALRRHVELMRAPYGGRIRRVEVSPPESWGGVGFGRVDVYYVDATRRPRVATLAEAYAAVGGDGGVTDAVRRAWRADRWLCDK
jgi:hypothetical protein